MIILLWNDYSVQCCCTPTISRHFGQLTEINKTPVAIELAIRAVAFIKSPLKCSFFSFWSFEFKFVIVFAISFYLVSCQSINNFPNKVGKIRRPNYLHSNLICYESWILIQTPRFGNNHTGEWFVLSDNGWESTWFASIPFFIFSLECRLFFMVCNALNDELTRADELL